MGAGRYAQRMPRVKVAMVKPASFVRTTSFGMFGRNFSTGVGARVGAGLGASAGDRVGYDVGDRVGDAAGKLVG